MTRWPIALLCAATLLPASPVQLPVEVTGADGTEASVTVEIPEGLGHRIEALWLQIHGLEYADMVSVRVNDGAWITLNNKTVAVAEPGKSYGGIGGGFATLKLTLPLAAGCMIDHTNTIRFRFNRTNGVVSGFRVLAFNFLAEDGSSVLPPSAFVQEDPNTWKAPFSDAANLAAGKNLWYNAKLTANSLPAAPPIRAGCGDCHTQDGRDLKYFNFSNASIVARSRFHGLSDLEGKQIASYIRSLTTPNPGRPWNPPYQPGAGLDARPLSEWAAGAGLSSVLENDSDTLAYLFPGKIAPAAFQPDGNLNAREVPIAMQLPDWNHWLPHVHPLDMWGDRFTSSAFAQLYEGGCQGEMAAFFEDWVKARSKFLTPHLTAGSKKWSAKLAEQFYSAQLWQLTKTWEMMQKSPLAERSWPNTIPAATAPTAVNIPDSPAGMGGSGLTNEYFSSAWYQLQVVMNSGNHSHHGRLPVDWVYLIGHFRDLQTFSDRAEPGRLLITLIKAMQFTDPRIGPGNIAEGWRLEATIDPRIMVDPKWAATFLPLPADVKPALTQALLAAWLDKTLQYPPAAYFQLGLSVGSYTRPNGLRDISGGRVWEAARQFQAAGVDAALVRRLEEWGRQYSSLARLYHY